jgi:hypothetical protein
VSAAGREPRTPHGLPEEIEELFQEGPRALLFRYLAPVRLALRLVTRLRGFSLPGCTSGLRFFPQRLLPLAERLRELLPLPVPDELAQLQLPRDLGELHLDLPLGGRADGLLDVLHVRFDVQQKLRELRLGDAELSLRLLDLGLAHVLDCLDLGDLLVRQPDLFQELLASGILGEGNGRYGEKAQRGNSDVFHVSHLPGASRTPHGL